MNIHSAAISISVIGHDLSRTPPPGFYEMGRHLAVRSSFGLAPPQALPDIDYVVFCLGVVRDMAERPMALAFSSTLTF